MPLWPCYALLFDMLVFGGKNDLIQLIIHRNDEISMINGLKSLPPAFFI